MEEYTISLDDDIKDILKKTTGKGKFKAGARTEIFTREELLDKLSRIKKPMHRALLAFLYLTGARVSEAIMVRKCDIRYENVEYDSHQEKYNFEGNLYVIVNLITEKRREFKVVTREVPIKVDKEKEFLKFIMPYWETIEDKDRLMFKIDRRRAWEFCVKYLKSDKGRAYPHLFRHTRITHWITLYNLKEESVRRLAGWSDTRPMRIYTHMRWKDTAQEMDNANFF